MRSIADKSYAVTFGKELTAAIIRRANNSPSSGVWTQAVYESLKEYAVSQGWRIYPELKCYAGEYLCDFTLFEDGYGCRLACESQWANVRTEHQNDLEWAFEKLLGVKADIKLFIFDGDDKHWPLIEGAYLFKYAQLSTDEIFILLRWDGNRFIKSLWQPAQNGLQKMIAFEDF